MTKTYETPKDIERDRLIEEASSNRNSQIYSSTTGIVGITSGSLLLGMLDKLDPSRRTLGKVVGIAGIVVGALSFGISFLSHRWAKKAEDQVKQIDREQALKPATNNFAPDSQHVARYQQEQLSSNSELTR